MLLDRTKTYAIQCAAAVPVGPMKFIKGLYEKELDTYMQRNSEDKKCVELWLIDGQAFSPGLKAVLQDAT